VPAAISARRLRFAKNALHERRKEEADQPAIVVAMHRVLNAL